MLILAHFGTAAFLAVLIGLPISFALIGAILPDVVDKGLLVVGLAPNGRFIAHTIWFGPLAALLTFALTKRKYLAFAILVGCYSHLLLDMGYFLPLFYPFVEYEFPTPEMGFGWMNIVTEGVGAVILYSSVRFKFKILYYRNVILIWLKNLFSWRRCTKPRKRKSRKG